MNADAPGRQVVRRTADGRVYLTLAGVEHGMAAAEAGQLCVQLMQALVEPPPPPGPDPVAGRSVPFRRGHTDRAHSRGPHDCPYSYLQRAERDEWIDGWNHHLAMENKAHG